MKIIIFGARGDVGSRVVQEALSRGHQVTEIVRSETQMEDFVNTVNVRVCDVGNTDEVANLMVGHDLAISVVRPPEGEELALVKLTRSVLEAAEQSQTRVLIVGGAASLRIPDGSGNTVLTAPGFLPESVVPIARACQAQYDLVSVETRVDWSYLCPPAMLRPGDRTGIYRVGGDALLLNSDGESAISMEDFAVALLDEAEKPNHQQARFTVAS